MSLPAMSSKLLIDEFIAEPAMALIGMSRTGRKFGNFAYRALTAKGYRVYPLHPSAEGINGVKCYPDCKDIPEHITNALISLRPVAASDAIRKAAAAGIRRVWLQQGAESAKVLNECRKLGLDVISGECILMFARPAGVHRVHQFVRGLRGKLPA